MEKEKRDPKEKKCAICGKDMYAGEDWAYKRRIGGERTKWFCSYKCMRAWDAKNGQKETRPAGLPADLDAPAPKEPVSRAVLARALAKEIKNGGSVIAYLTAEGYKNPYEAYNAVRHYCETKAPELAEVLKPLRDLPKGPQKKTGRPRKRQVEVETVDQVPPVEPDLQPVQCIAHVTAAEIQEAIEKQEPLAPMPLILQGGVNYQVLVDEERKPEIDPKEAMAGLSKALGDFENKVLTREKVLRIVDEAALECLEDREYRWGSDTLEQSMFRDAKMNAEAIGMMRLRKAIRKKLGADKE